MTTQATKIRNAVYDRLATLRGYNSFRKTPVPQVQPKDLPSLAVYIMSENMVPDGDANAGEPHYVSDVTVAISVIRGFDDPAVLAGSIDEDIDAIETKLLTDPKFVGFGPNALFEAVPRIQRRRLYPNAGKDGETYFAELRLEMTFQTRCSFEPVIPDNFDGVTISARPWTHGHQPNDPNIAPVIIKANPTTL